MIIEIHKAGFINKGAELMLFAILTKIRMHYPHAIFTIAPSTSKGSFPFSKITQAGCFPKVNFEKYGIQWGNIASVLPYKLRDAYGLILEKDVDIVIDAAGFAYSDQWGDHNAVQLAKATKRWKKNGSKVILLPQAFGPFTSEKIKEAMQTIVENTDIIFSREELSYNHLQSISENSTKIKIAPDFTNLITGISPDSPEYFKEKVCIIPNHRMIDKIHNTNKESYPVIMAKCIDMLNHAGVSSFILVHEGQDDLQLAHEFSKMTLVETPILQEDNPLKLKGIIGSCKGVIGSRFHGLVSALSQGVPTLATGWSHKYQQLFKDYQFEDGLFDLNISDQALQQKLGYLINEQQRIQLTKNLRTQSEHLKNISENMWKEVFQHFEKPISYKTSASTSTNLTALAD